MSLAPPLSPVSVAFSADESTVRVTHGNSGDPSWQGYPQYYDYTLPRPKIIPWGNWAPAPASSAVQDAYALALGAQAAGTFTLATNNGGTVTTAPIAYNCQAADIQAAFVATGFYQPADLTVAEANGVFTIVFNGSLGQSNQNLAADFSGLSAAANASLSQTAIGTPALRAGQYWWVNVPAGNIPGTSPGNDATGDGSLGKPFATIGKAVSSAIAGDIIYILPGTYSEGAAGSVGAVVLSGLNIPYTSKTRQVVISCAPKAFGGYLGSVVVKQSQAMVQAWTSTTLGAPSVHLAKGITNIILNGLILPGARSQPYCPFDVNTPENHADCGVFCETGAPDSTIQNSVIYYHCHCGVKTGNDDSTGFVAQGNVIFENGLNALDHGIYAHGDNSSWLGNIVFKNGGPDSNQSPPAGHYTGYGIQMYGDDSDPSGPKNQQVIGNVFFGQNYLPGVAVNSQCAGITVQGNGHTIKNNTVLQCFAGLAFIAPVGASDISNNIFSGNRWDAFSSGDIVPPPSCPSAFDYNTLSCPSNNNPANGGGGSYQNWGADNVVNTDPRLANPPQDGVAGTGDCRLKSTSPCLSNGAPDCFNRGAY